MDAVHDVNELVGTTEMGGNILESFIRNEYSPENVFTVSFGLLIFPMDKIEIEHTYPIWTPANDEENGDGNCVAGDSIYGQLYWNIIKTN
jgi:hypothetical protein